MLFIGDDKTQVLKFHISLDEGMGTDQDVDLPSFNFSRRRALPFPLHRACQKGDSCSGRFKERTEGVCMLLC